jgi:glycosyltransferase involved in cell wall biosynthesis
MNKKQRFCRDEREQKTGLLSLIKKIPKNILMVELGSFAGESTEMFAKKAKVVYSVDIWSSSAEAMSRVAGSDEKASDIEERFNLIMNKNENIIKIKKRTDEAQFLFQSESIDFVYLDAAHDYESVKTDIKNWVSKVKPNGYMGGHDYNKKDFPGVIKAVTEFFGDKVEVFDDTSWLVKVSDEIVTFLMPVFNREKMVRQAIESVQNQTKENWRLICFDDVSKDNSVDVIKKYTERDNRISLITDPSNKGITHARNSLLKNCKTRLAAWVDSDDILNKYRLEIQFPIVRRGGVYVLSNAFWFHSEKDIFPNKFPEKRVKDKWQCPAPCVPGFSCANSTPSGIFEINKEIEFKHHYFNCGSDKKKYFVGEDCYFLRRSIESGIKPIVLDDILYYHRQHAERMINVVCSQTNEQDFHELFYKQREGRKGFRRVVVTIMNGDFYEYLAKYTHYDLRRYAGKCGADFIILKNNETSKTNEMWAKSCWQKFEMKSLFEKYDEILYIDTDFIIQEDAENLFDLVPQDHVGFFEEYNYSPAWVNSQYSEYLDNLGLSKRKYFDKKYYNAGIFLVRKDHEELFDFPKTDIAFKDTWRLCAEQSWFNINIKKHKIPVYDLGPKFNAFVRDEKDGELWGIPLRDIRMFHLCGIFGIDKQSKEYALDVITSLKKKIKKSKEGISIKSKEAKSFRKVSVLMPVFNREKYVVEAILSVLKQTYTNFNFLIYDDDSTDNSKNIIKSLAIRDKRIVLLEGNKNVGVAEARNILLRECKTEFACWQDSDDLSNMYRLENQIKFISQFLLVKTNCMAFNALSDPYIEEEPKAIPAVFNSLPSTMFPVDSLVFYDKALKLGGEDVDWERRMLKGRRIYALPEVLYYYRLHPERMTLLADKIKKTIPESVYSNESYASLIKKI